MRVLGISGSPRLGGNTDILVNTALGVLAKEGLETEFLSLADRPVKPCLACGRCMTSETVQCLQEDPAFEGVLEKVAAADGILVGSPVYFWLGHATDNIVVGSGGLRRPTASATAAAQSGRGDNSRGGAPGQAFTFAQLNYFFLIAEMIVPGSNYWNVAIAREKGDVQEDHEGVETIKTLARNMAWLMKKLEK